MRDDAQFKTKVRYLLDTHQEAFDDLWRIASAPAILSALALHLEARANDDA